MPDVKAIVKKHNTIPIWIGKTINYEYWPIWFFYIPIGFYIFFLAIKARSFTFFTGVNPSMKDSGIIKYSKFDVMASIPNHLKPKGILIRKDESISGLPPFLTYPLIAKPDMGERGKGVMIVHTDNELQTYSSTIKQDFILQEFCDHPQEAGIFYVRRPSETKGRITSFTTKEFLHVIGDGNQNIGQLMSQTFRARLQMYRLSPKFLKSIPKEGQYVKIEAIGNHNRGTRFINSNHLISEKLLTIFDDISKNVDGFYYGRYDLKFNMLEEMEEGKNFKIVELNGINSEPVHIYDQQTGLINAYKDFFAHMRYIYEISLENKAIGVKRTPVIKFWKSIFAGKG